VKYELGFYIPEDGILHSHRRADIHSYLLLKSAVVWNVAPCRCCESRVSEEGSALHFRIEEPASEE
jgi:hypothetical protein